MSFTTGGLFLQKSVSLAALYLECADWTKVREMVLSENLLQARTIRTLKRSCGEIIARLSTVSSAELVFLVEANPREQRYLLWLAVCRRHKFIAEFAVEILRERFLSLKSHLQYEDFDAFFNKKAEWQEEIDNIRPSTRSKLRQVLFKILREADLLTANNLINPARLSPKLIELIDRGDRREVFYFPVHETDIKRMTL